MNELEQANLRAECARLAFTRHESSSDEALKLAADLWNFVESGCLPTRMLENAQK